MVCESVKVIVRCRPMNQREKDLTCKSALKIDPTNALCSLYNVVDDNLPPKHFTFDGAYDINSQTEQIYNEISYPVVEGVVEGYNGTVFAYGQTGCGKSFTMQGVENSVSQKGIIPRAFEHIFEAIAASEGSKFLVHSSYLEIYNEEVRDLLGKDSKKKLDLKEHPEKGVYIPGLSVHAVHNVKECESIMKKGWSNRSVGSTLMNADSSRSHSIFTIYLETMKIRDDGQETIRKGKLNLVDLAGSERQAKTGATGSRLKEATKINLSLSALGNVISALVDGKSKHIPYRDSKLTRLLQDSLGGNTKTLMIACISPADNNYDETLSTLRYANRAKNIKNKPKINQDPKEALLREYQLEIERLKNMLDGKTISDIMPVSTASTKNESNNLLEENIRKEYDEKIKEMKLKYEQEQETKAKLQEDVEKLKNYYQVKLDEVGTNKANQLMTNGVSSINKENEESQLDQTQALQRLKQLEQDMVGGERSNDNALKEKRAKRKKMAEKKIMALAAALAKAEEGDDSKMMDVYESIQEEVRVKNELLKKYRRKVRELDQEIIDIQSEFEFDRMDYLETIRRQDQQQKLVQQILDKIQPCLRRDCNYSNLEKVRRESRWDEDTQKWKIPEMEIIRTVLPPTGIQPGGRIPQTQPSCQSSVFDDLDEDKFFKKLEKSEKEDIAGNYFRPKRNMRTSKSTDMNKSNGRVNVLSNSFNGGLSFNLSNSAPAFLNSTSGKESRKPIRLESLSLKANNNPSRNSPSVSHKFPQTISSTRDST